MVFLLIAQIQVLKQMVGYVIGRGGEHINNIQSNCGVRLQFQNGNLCTLTSYGL
jgi:polyribonucleotide nucleotidyltransferase